MDCESCFGRSLVHQVVMHIVGRHPAGISRLRLIQLVRLFDLMRQEDRQPPCAVDYEGSFFGPYSKTVIEAVKALESCGALAEDDNRECATGKCKMSSDTEGMLSPANARMLDMLILASAGVTTAGLCSVDNTTWRTLFVHSRGK